MKTVVLLSGGWDSAACVFRMKELGEEFDLMFVDYGQKYRDRELEKAALLAEFLLMPLLIRTAPCIRCDQRGRNFAFIMEMQKAGYDRVVIGSRNVLPMFDKYKDSNWWSLKAFGRLMQMRIVTPITFWGKKRVVNYVRAWTSIDFYNCYENKTDKFACDCVNCVEMRSL